MKLSVEAVAEIVAECKRDKEKGWCIDHINTRANGSVNDMNLCDPRNLQIMFWTENLSKGSKRYDNRPDHLKEKWELIIDGVYTSK